MSNPKLSIRGFTLIELLVAVSIISILAVISINTFTNLQKNSRDTKRKSDLGIIQSALEQYHADQGFYPTCIKAGCPDMYIDNTSLQLTSSTGNPLPPATVRTYLNKLAVDPKNICSGLAECYKYGYASGKNGALGGCDNDASTGNYCTTYCLYAAMENTSNGGFTGFCTSGGAFNYSVIAP